MTDETRRVAARGDVDLVRGLACEVREFLVPLWEARHADLRDLSSRPCLQPAAPLPSSRGRTGGGGALFRWYAARHGLAGGIWVGWLIIVPLDLGNLAYDAVMNHAALIRDVSAGTGLALTVTGFLLATMKRRW